MYNTETEARQLLSDFIDSRLPGLCDDFLSNCSYYESVINGAKTDKITIDSVEYLIDCITNAIKIG